MMRKYIRRYGKLSFVFPCKQVLTWEFNNSPEDHKEGCKTTACMYVCIHDKSVVHGKITESDVRRVNLHNG